MLARHLAFLAFAVVATLCLRPLSGDALEWPNAAQDFADQLPRTLPKSPEESLAEFVVADGFEVQLVAAEPQVVDPVAIDFDSAGRAYVVCMRGYSERGDDQLGEVRVLEDSTGDGRLDKARVFASGLSWPTAVCCYDGGVFVGAAPEILYLKDTDGDGTADLRTVVFRGFSRDNVQGLLNSFRWGLDNRIHVAVSTSGARIHRADAPAQSILLRGRDFSFDPRTLGIEIESGGGQHGMSFDDWGRKYVTSNSNHIQQVVVEDRYLRRNLQLPPVNATAMIAADGPQAEVFRISPVEPWRVLRTRLRVAGEVPGPIEGGGRAAGYFTGATGVTISRGDAWPEASRGLAFIGDVGSNIVHRKRISAAGVQRLAERMDVDREFLASRETWFRPIQFANAPDGALWLLDMYREVIEHPASLPPSIKQHLDLNSGAERGRIYRIAPEGFTRTMSGDLLAATARELVESLKHPNAWHRESAARRLFELQDDSVVPALKEMASTDATPLTQLHALYALAGLGRLDASTILAGMGSAKPEVRRHAVRLAEPLLVSGESPEAARKTLLDSLNRLADDVDIEVRFQVALTVGEVPTAAARLPILQKIARRDLEDPWMRLAVQTSLDGCVGDLFASLAVDKEFLADSASDGFLASLAELSANDDEARDVILQSIHANWPRQPESATRQFLSLADALGSSAERVKDKLHFAEAGAKVIELLSQDVLRTLQSQEQPITARQSAAELLWLVEWDEASPIFVQLLSPREPPAVRAAAIRALGRIANPNSARLLLTEWNSLSPALRGQATTTVFARTEHLLQLLQAVELGDISPSDLSADFKRRLAIHPDERIKAMNRKFFAADVNTKRSGVIARYANALPLSGDVNAGETVFANNCAKCHRVGGVGHEIGPPLADVATKSKEELLTAILDPNREINPKYVEYVAETQDGRVVTGVISAESAAAITLTREEGQNDTIRRDNLAELSSTGKSIMPEGLEQEITLQRMADLLEFLTSPE